MFTTVIQSAKSKLESSFDSFTSCSADSDLDAVGSGGILNLANAMCDVTFSRATSYFGYAYEGSLGFITDAASFTVKDSIFQENSSAFEKAQLLHYTAAGAVLLQTNTFKGNLTYDGENAWEFLENSNSLYSTAFYFSDPWLEVSSI